MSPPAFLERAVNFAREVLPWSLPLKLIISALLGALGGASLLGYLSEYATYSYAIFYGFRPPLEGIPYLKATVTLGSLALLATGAAVFVLSILLVKALLWSLEWFLLGFGIVKNRLPTQVAKSAIDFGHVVKRLRERPMWQVILAATTISIFFGLLAYGEALLLNRIPQPEPLPPLQFAVALATYGFIVTLAISRAAAGWWLAAISTLIYFVVWAIILFSPTKYSQFLRMVGYGGGIPVTLELSGIEQNKKIQPERYYLMIRTTDALIVFDAAENSFVEFSRGQVTRITHPSGGFRSVPYRMPSTLSARE